MLEKQICLWGIGILFSFYIKPQFTLGITHKLQHIQNFFPSWKNDTQFSLKDLLGDVPLAGWFLKSLVGQRGLPAHPPLSFPESFRYQKTDNFLIVSFLIFPVSSPAEICYYSVLSCLKPTPLAWWSRPSFSKDIIQPQTSITFSQGFWMTVFCFLICISSFL